MPKLTKDLRRGPEAAKDFVPEKMDGWEVVFYDDREVEKYSYMVKKRMIFKFSSLSDLKAEMCNGNGPPIHCFWTLKNEHQPPEKIAEYEKQITEWDGRRKLVIYGRISDKTADEIRGEFRPIRYVAKVVWTEEE